MHIRQLLFCFKAQKWIYLNFILKNVFKGETNKIAINNIKINTGLNSKKKIKLDNMAFVHIETNVSFNSLFEYLEDAHKNDLRP